MPRRGAFRAPGAVLLLIDVINPLDFDGGDRLLRSALPAARRIAALKSRLRRAGVPAVYANDNFGHWNLSLAELADLQCRRHAPGREIIDMLRPKRGDHYVLKPRHSAFYGTGLEPLLDHLGARRLILTGFAANICVWFTANDAYMREYRLNVPSDCTAAERPADVEYVLEQMRRVMGADVRPASALSPTVRRS